MVRRWRLRARPAAGNSSERAPEQRASDASVPPSGPVSPRPTQASAEPEAEPEAEAERDGPVSWTLLVVAFVVIVVAAAGPLLFGWDTLEMRGALATVTLAATGVLLGVWAGDVTKLTIRARAALLIGLATLLIVAVGGYAHLQNSRPINVTDKATFGKKDGHTFKGTDGDGLDITVPLPEERDTLKLTFTAEDLDPATGTSCLPSSSLHLTEPELMLNFGQGQRISIKGKQGTVRLHAKLESDPACRIQISVSSAIIES